MGCATSPQGEFPEPSELLELMRAAGVRMVRMFPSASASSHRFSLATWCIGELLRELERARVPLEVDFALFRRDEPPWDAIHEVCESYPELPIVLIDVQGRNSRSLYPLMSAHGNLYLQTAGVDIHCGLEDMCARFGVRAAIWLRLPGEVPWRGLRPVGTERLR